MYGIYANIWGILMVNVTIYSIHESYGHILVCVFICFFLSLSHIYIYIRIYIYICTYIYNYIYPCVFKIHLQSFT